jgi:uncharacterized lipoprotein YddW (UPF0748 family)
MADLIAGVVEDYPVDGVHLDYIRTGGICFNDVPLDYPGTEFDYAGCQADYAAWTQATYGRPYTLWEDTDGVRLATEVGRERLAAWQVHSVGLLVQAIHHAVRQANPAAIISVASVRNAPWELPVQGQTAWAWLDAGWIDAMFPTLYLAETDQIVERLIRLQEAVPDEARRDHIFAGLATHNFDDPRGEDWTVRVVERVNALLRDGSPDRPAALEAKGVALFRGEYFSPATIEALARGPFRAPALPYWGTP